MDTLMPILFMFAVGSWLLTVVEFVAAAVFAKWAFASGIVVLRVTDPALEPSASASRGETENGLFRRRDDGSFLVRYKQRFFAPFAVRTPVALRGTVRFADRKASLEARAPLGP